MSSIICNWLNSEIILSENIDEKSLHLQFSSGYLLGELMFKYNMITDFELFKPQKNSQSKLDNFMRLEKAFITLGIELPPNTIKDIMDGVPGVINNLLYQLFILLENKKNSNLTSAAMDIMNPTGPTNLKELQMPLKLDRLKRTLRRQCDMSLQELSDKFDEKRLKSENMARLKELESCLQHKNLVKQRRNKLMLKSKSLRLAQAEIMAKIENSLINIPKVPVNKTLEAIKLRTQQKIEREGQLSLQDIENFEVKLKEVQVIQQSERTMLADRKSTNENFDEELDEEETLQNTTEQASFPNQKSKFKSAAESADQYFQTIKKQTLEIRLAKEEHEKQRRRALFLSNLGHEQELEEKRNRVLAERLMRQSQMERRIAVQLMHVRREKAFIIQNRLEREKLFRFKREEEFKAALDREKEIIFLEQKDLENRERATAEFLEKIKQERACYKYAKHLRIVKDEVVKPLIDLVLKIIEYGELTGEKIPFQFLREWKELFIRYKPIKNEIRQSVEEVEAGDRMEKTAEVLGLSRNELLETKMKLLDDLNMENYLNFMEDWNLDTILKPLPYINIEEFTIKTADASNRFSDYSSSNMVDLENELSPKHKIAAENPLMPIPQANTVLSKVLDRINRIAYPPPRSPSPPRTPDFSIRAAIVGPSFSGKSSIVDFLNEKNRCISIKPKDLIKEAIHAAEINEIVEKDANQVDDIDSNKEIFSQPSARALLGIKILAQLEEGTLVDDQTLVELILERIMRIKVGFGWILDGFPATAEQAQLLHQYMSSKNIEGTNENTMKFGKSSPVLDLVIQLDVPFNELIKRASLEAHLVDKRFAIDTITNDSMADKITSESLSSDATSKLKHLFDAYISNNSKMNKWLVQKKYSIRKIKSTTLMKDETSELTDEQLIEKNMLAMHLEIERIISNFLNKNTEPISTSSRAFNTPQPSDGIIDYEQSLTYKLDEISSVSQLKHELDHTPRSSDAYPRATSVERALSVISNESRKSTPKSGKGSRIASGKKDKTKNGSSARTSPKRMTTSDQEGKKSPADKKRVSSAKKKSPRSNNSQEMEEIESEKKHSPRPGDENWEWVNVPIDQTLANSYNVQEDTYLSAAKTIFRQLRMQKEDVIMYLYNGRRNFHIYLRRPDAKQQFVDQFIKGLNLIPEDMRLDQETKSELHFRLLELRECLYGIAIENKNANVVKIPLCIDSQVGWLSDRIVLIANLYLALMQAELDHFQDRIRLLTDYYRCIEKPQTFDDIVPNGTLLQGTVDLSKVEYFRLPFIQMPPDVMPKIASMENSAQTQEASNVGRGPSRGNERQISRSDSSSSRNKSPPMKVAGSNNPSSRISRGPDSPSAGINTVSAVPNVPSINFGPDEEVLNALPQAFKTKVNFIARNSTFIEILNSVISSGPKNLQPNTKQVAGPAKGAPASKGTAFNSTLANMTAVSAVAFVPENTTPCQEDLHDKDVKMLYDSYLCSLSIANHLIQLERQLRLLEVEEDQDIDITPETTLLVAGGKDAKGRPSARKSGDKKKGAPTPTAKKDLGASESKSQDSVHADANTEETSEMKEARLAKSLRSKIRKEHLAALESELQWVTLRLTAIRAVAINVLLDLKERTAHILQEMEDSIADRVVKEHAAIGLLLKTLGLVIEKGQKICENLTIDGDRFFVSEHLKQDLVPNVKKCLPSGKRISPGIAERKISSPLHIDGKDIEDRCIISGFKLKHLRCLIEKFKEATTTSYLRKSVFQTILGKSVLYRIEQLRENVEKESNIINDQDDRISSIISQTASEYSSQKTDSKIEAYRETLVNWRGFMMSLLFTYLKPDICNYEWPKTEDLMKISRILEDFEAKNDPDQFGHILMKEHFKFIPFELVFGEKTILIKKEFSELLFEIMSQFSPYENEFCVSSADLLLMISSFLLCEEKNNSDPLYGFCRGITALTGHYVTSKDLNKIIETKREMFLPSTLIRKIALFNLPNENELSNIFVNKPDSYQNLLDTLNSFIESRSLIDLSQLMGYKDTSNIIKMAAARCRIPEVSQEFKNLLNQS